METADATEVFGDTGHAEPPDRPGLAASGLAGSSSTGIDIVGHIQRHPYQSLLIAAGVGYVLGGGLFTKLTFNVVRVGMRVGAMPVVQRELLGLAEAALNRTAQSPLHDPQ